MSVPEAVLEIIRQDELELTHEVYQPASEGPFTCDRCIFRTNPEVTRCGHPVIAAKGLVVFDGKTYMGRNGQVEPKACCDFFKRDPAVSEREAVAKHYPPAAAILAWARWANSGERFDKEGRRQKDGPYARNVLEFAEHYGDHLARKKVTPEVAEAYGRRETINPIHVASGQRRLHVGRLFQYVIDPNVPPQRGPRRFDGVLPIIMRRRGGLSMIDGNHRLAAAKLRGETAFDAVVVDMDRAERMKFEGVIEFSAPPSLESLLPKVKKRELANPDLVGRRESKWHVHVVADRHVEATKRAVKTAFEHGRAKLKDPKDWRRAVAAASKELRRSLPALLEKIAAESGAQAYQKLAARPAPLLKRWWFRKDDGFDARHPGLRAWVRRHTGELVTGVDKATRRAIADYVEEAYAEDVGRRDLIDAIGDLIGDDDRAETIARTETMRAANAGQREGWAQATEDGLLEPDARRVWIVTDDDRLCEDCEAMDGEEADVDGNYPGEGGDGPPLHPDCRCTEGLA